MVGHYLESASDLVKRMVEEGHTVGNHTYHHVRGYQTCTKLYLRDAQKGAEILHTSLFRPPHGRMTYSQKKAIRQLGNTIYLWDVLTHDYNPKYTPEKMLAIVQHFTRNGSIIVFHDSLKSKERMLKVLPHIIEWLQNQSYSIQPLPNPLTSNNQ